MRKYILISCLFVSTLMAYDAICNKRPCTYDANGTLIKVGEYKPLQAKDVEKYFEENIKFKHITKKLLKQVWNDETFMSLFDLNKIAYNGDEMDAFPNVTQNFTYTYSYCFDDEPYIFCNKEKQLNKYFFLTSLETYVRDNKIDFSKEKFVLKDHMKQIDIIYEEYMAGKPTIEIHLEILEDKKQGDDNVSFTDDNTSTQTPKPPQNNNPANNNTSTSNSSGGSSGGSTSTQPPSGKFNPVDRSPLKEDEVEKAFAVYIARGIISEEYLKKIIKHDHSELYEVFPLPYRKGGKLLNPYDDNTYRLIKGEEYLKILNEKIEKYKQDMHISPGQQWDLPPDFLSKNHEDIRDENFQKNNGMPAGLEEDRRDDHEIGQVGRDIENETYPFTPTSECNCNEYINEGFIQHTERDITKQLYQMNIDQRNFAKFFLKFQMPPGTAEEARGIEENIIQTQSDLSILDEMIFITNKLNQQKQVSLKNHLLLLKSDLEK